MHNKFPFIHNDLSIKKINLIYIIALIFPITFGFYKNGINLYQKNLIPIYKMFNPIFYPLLGALICILNEYLYLKFKNKKYTLNTFFPIQGMIVGCLVYPSVNIFIYIIIMFIVSFFVLFLKRGNKTSLLGLIILLLFSLFKYTPMNVYELANASVNSTGLMFVGFTKGGISSTSALFLTFSYIYLSTKIIYKKEASFYYFLTFFILCFFLFLINHHLFNSFMPLLSYNTFFSGVFILTDIKSCPTKNMAKKIYGITCAILIFSLIMLFKFSLSSLLVISILSFFTPNLDKIVTKIKHF